MDHRGRVQEGEEDVERQEGQRDEDLGEKGLSDPVDPPLNPPNEDNPEVQVEDNPITPPEGATTVSTVFEEDPIIDVVGNAGEGASSNRSPVLQVD